MAPRKYAITLAATVVLLLVGVVSQPALARRHWPPKPKPTTTTTTVPTTTVEPTTTTIVEPTTTTVEPTTTTVDPTTTTTAASLVCGGPITIIVGGTYSGCYESTSTGTPAVTISTTEVVTLDHARVIAAGYGLQDSVTGARLTVTNTKFEQTDPGAVVGHRAIELDNQPASLVVEYNQLTDTDGIWVCCSAINPLTVRFNVATQIGRYPHPTGGNCCVQFLQLDSVSTPAGEVAWNQVVNTSEAPNHGEGDVLNFYHSGGSDSAHRLDVHHNLVDGAYPPTPADTTYAGGGIMGVDGAGGTYGHTSIHDNTVVSTTNYGVACAGGVDCHTSGNLLVNDTLGSDGTTHYYSAFGQAHSMHDTTGSDATGDVYNWRRDGTATQYACWQTPYCVGGTGGTQVATTEQQARDTWAADLAATGLTVGPDW